MMNFPVCLRVFLSLGDPNRGLKGYFALWEHTRDELIVLTIVYLLCNLDVLSFFCYNGASGPYLRVFAGIFLYLRINPKT